ncbi:unnamed protein product, partial [marine sediment metagenome]
MTDITLSGVGWATKLVPADGVNTIVIGDRADSYPSERIIIRDLYIDGSNQTAHTAGGTDPETQELDLGIEIAGGSTNDIQILNCFFYSTGNDAVYGYETGWVTVSECKFNDIRGYWAAVHPHLGEHKFIVENNTFYYCDAAAIRHAHIITGNDIFRCGAGEDYTIFSGDTTTIISNNYIRNTGGFGGDDGTIRVWNKGCIVEGNTIYWCEGAAIYVANYSQTGGSIVKDNLIYYASDHYAGAPKIYAIYTEEPDTVIEGNHIEVVQKGHGIYLNEAHRSIVSDNLIRDVGKATDNTYDGIFLNGADYCLVSGNQIASDEANKPRHGIHVTDGHYNLIQGNHIEDTATDGLHIDGDSDHNKIIQNVFQSIAGDGIELNAGTVNDTIVKGNRFHTVTGAYVVDAGTDTVYDVKPYQFTEATGGAAAIQVTSPTGVYVSDAGGTAIAWGQLPASLQQVMRLKVWAVAKDAPAAAGGFMHCEFTFNAGASNAAYNEAAKSWNIANKNGEEAD